MTPEATTYRLLDGEPLSLISDGESFTVSPDEPVVVPVVVPTRRRASLAGAAGHACGYGAQRVGRRAAPPVVAAAPSSTTGARVRVAAYRLRTARSRPRRVLPTREPLAP